MIRNINSYTNMVKTGRAAREKRRVEKARGKRRGTKERREAPRERHARWGARERERERERDTWFLREREREREKEKERERRTRRKIMRRGGVCLLYRGTRRCEEWGSRVTSCHSALPSTMGTSEYMFVEYCNILEIWWASSILLIQVASRYVI